MQIVGNGCRQTEDNYLRNEVFHQIQAVSFKDYDEDGNMDVCR